MMHFKNTMIALMAIQFSSALFAESIIGKKDSFPNEDRQKSQTLEEPYLISSNGNTYLVGFRYEVSSKFDKYELETFNELSSATANGVCKLDGFKKALFWSFDEFYFYGGLKKTIEYAQVSSQGRVLNTPRIETTDPKYIFSSVYYLDTVVCK